MTLTERVVCSSMYFFHCSKTCLATKIIVQGMYLRYARLTSIPQPRNRTLLSNSFLLLRRCALDMYSTSGRNGAVLISAIFRGCGLRLTNARIIYDLPLPRSFVIIPAHVSIYTSLVFRDKYSAISTLCCCSK